MRRLTCRSSEWLGEEEVLWGSSMGQKTCSRRGRSLRTRRPGAATRSTQGRRGLLHRALPSGSWLGDEILEALVVRGGTGGCRGCLALQDRDSPARAPQARACAREREEAGPRVSGSGA